MNEHYCTSCNRAKELSAFEPRYDDPTKLRSQCRACRSAAEKARVDRKALERALTVTPPEWSVLGPHYPHTADGLLVPVDRLTEAQRQQVRELNVLRRAAGVWLINLGDG